MSKDQPSWRVALNAVIEGISARQFSESLHWLCDRYGDDPLEVTATYTSMLITLFAEAAGLLAVLDLPPAEVPAALAEIRATLAHLDFDKQRKRVKRKDRRYYDQFAEWAAPLLAEVGEVMEALFNCYVAGDYDPAADPDALIVEALQAAEQDWERTRRLMTQAGAIALHGRPLWWRWDKEGYGPARHWLTTMAILVGSYTNDGTRLLTSYAEIREQSQIMHQGPGERLQEPPLPETEPSPVDTLIEELIEQGEKKFTQEQLALCQAHLEEAVPALIALATDEELQMEDAPGGGYVPIRAVELLGRLRAAEAVPPLIDIIADTEPDAIIRDVALSSVIEIGPAAREPVLAFMRYSRMVEAKVMLAELFSEIGEKDERAYGILLDVWKEATWDDGKALLAYPLACTGGEQVIPLLQDALDDPQLDSRLDYNEIANVLEELGVTVPPPDHLTTPFGPESLRAFMVAPVEDLRDPQRLEAVAESAPEAFRSHSDYLAAAFAFSHLRLLSIMTAVQVLCFSPESAMDLVSNLLEAVEALTFDASTKGYPEWVRKAYRSLAEEAGPRFQNWFSGILIPLWHYLAGEYDIAEDPDRLLLDARERVPDDEDKARLFGRAGALILHGRPCWSRWSVETDPPLSDWLFGLFEFRTLLERVGQIPLQSGSEELLPELVDMMMEEDREEENIPPQVAELLDLLVAKKQDTLSPLERRRFANQYALVVPHLMRMVEDKTYWLEDGPGEGWAAILAARLLGELGAIQAADTLVNAIADSSPDDVIHDAALFSLLALGRPALSAVQAYFRYGRNIEVKTCLAEVLGRIGRRSTDSFDLLRQVWDEATWTDNRRMVALAFGDLGDRRAVPLLRAALDDPEADAADIEYVVWALRQLGAPVARVPKRSPHLKTPMSYTPRLLYDDDGYPLRLKHTAWGEPICPHCNQPLVFQDDEWVHSEAETRTAAPTGRRLKRKRKRR